MSAPQTNLEKQKRWHKGPLIGITLGLAISVALMFYWSGAGSDPAAAPDAQGNATGAPAVVEPADEDDGD